MTTTEWDHLMRAARSGDRASLVALLAALKEPLFAYLFRLCRNPEIAEDLLQETLITLCTRADTWDPARPLRPWIYTIARNKFLEGRRRDRKVVPLIRPEKLASPATGSQPSPDRLALRDALATLAEPIREAFLLKHFARLTFEEVADVQGIPVPTAKSRVRFAVQKLRGLLGDEHENA
ncbi:MAG: sigma-70 family RNA polymerase sigma factor [Candidatus Riflebacteria bacterium]|nr:sigma-70 family RNA polymerase sigma factor [Candidatus Riflebacteria bacterium]